MDKLAAMTAFVQVVETGSFTKAADVLALPKARISQRVSDLERHLQIRLLHRTTRSLTLTEDGQAYFPKCQAILHDIDELESTLKGAAVEPRGKLRIAALVSVARWIIAPYLHEFQARYPHIFLQLSASDRVTHLLEEGIDCAFRGGQLEDSSHIARHIADVRFGLYASPSYFAHTAMPTHPQELVQHRRLSWFTGQRLPFAWRLETDNQHYELPSDDGLSFDDPDIAIASCMSGAGICPGAPFAVKGYVDAGALVPVLPEWSFEPRPLHILYPTNKHLSMRVRCFVEWSLELMQQNPNLPMSPLALAQQHSNLTSTHHPVAPRGQVNHCRPTIRLR